MNVAQLTIEMAANVARLKTDMAAARNTVEGTMTSIRKAAGLAQTALGAIGAGLSIAAFSGWIKGAINAADEANKLAQKIGITVKEIGGLQLAFKQGGVDAESMQTALAKLNKNIVAGDSAFKALGVSTKNTDGSFRSTSSVLADVADRFANTQDGAAKTAMAIDIFGKSGAALIPVLNAGGNSIREFQVLADQLGLTLSEETAAAAEKFNDTLELIGMGTRGVANQVMAELLPTLQTLAGEFLNLMTQGGNLKGVADVISAGLKGMFTVAAVGVEIFRTLGNTIGATAAGIVAFASGDFKGAVTIIGELGKDIRTNWTGTLESLDRLWNQSGNTAIEAAAKITSGSLQSGKAMEEAAKAASKLAEEQEKARKAADDLVASIRFETETMQMSNLEREIANNLLKLEKTGLQENTDEYRAYAEAIRLATIENEGIKERIKLEKEAADKRKKIEEDYAREVEQINFQIGQSLTDALINGGQTAKEFLINMFKTLILRPILQPIIQGGTSMVMGALGMGASGSAMATPGSLSNTAGLGQIGQLASTMNTLYTGIAGGFTAISGAIGSGLASLASATGSTGLASFAAGMQGASLAPGLAGPTTAGATGAMGAGATAAAFTQGVAGIGAGVLAGEFISGGKSLIGGNSLWTTGGGAAAGAAIGTAVLPGIGTAIGGLIGGIVGGIANAAFGSGAKQLQGGQMASGTITATGVQDAQFYQNWKKAGGWFRSDQYGRDTQAMSQELVTYINDASQAIRDSGKDYATLLKLSAEGIDAVALSFNFAVGSMEELTENLGNTLDDYANKVADAILAGTNFGKAGETSYETIQRLINSLNIVNPIMDTLGLTLYDMSASGGAAASAFIDLIGGMDQFTQVTDFFYQNFYTEAERTAKTTENLTKIFEEMNLELPSTAIQFRALVESARAAGNDVLVANLLKLAPAFMQIAETAQNAAAAIQQERQALMSELSQLTGNTSSYNQTATTTTDEYNQALANHINTIKAAKAAYETTQKATDAAFDALQRAVDKQKQTVNQNLSGLKSIFDFLQAQIDDLLGVTTKSRASAWEYINQAASGFIDPEQNSLVSAVTSIKEGFTTSQYKTAFEMQRDRAVLAGQLTKISVKTSDQISIAEQQLIELDGILETAQKQLDAARGIQTAIENGTITVTSALANFAAALAAESSARTTLTNVNTPFMSEAEWRKQKVTGLYQSILERNPEEQGLKYWSESNLSVSQIASAIENSPENRQQEVTRMYESILGRAPEQAGLNYWAGSNLTLDQVKSAIEQSPEAKARGFASGGYYPGGLAMVGENGPELINFSDPGMVYNAGQTSRILAGGDDVVTEIRNLREENKVQSRALVNLQNRMTRLLERWDGDGLPEERMVTA